MPDQADERADAEGVTDVDPDAEESTGSFAFFSLTGDRFDAPGMPADTAKEVGFFREAVLSVARQLWLDANPGRSRVPAGFAEAFDLRLTAVHEGSAVPQLHLNKSQKISDQDWEEFVRFFRSAVNVIADGVNEAVEAQGDVTSDEPEHAPDSVPVDKTSSVGVLKTPAVVASLRKLGSTLDETESIILGSPLKSGPRVTLDHHARVILNPKLDELGATQSEQVSVEGVIVEYDGSTQSFRLEMLSGNAICKLAKDEVALALVARDNLAVDGISAADVVVVGETNNPAARNLQIFSVHSIDVVRSFAEKRLIAQLEQISALEEQWLGPDSEKPSKDTVERVRSLLPTLALLDVPVQVVPNSEGAIVLEARRGILELSVAVEPNGEMFMCSDNVETNDLEEAQVDFDGGRLEQFLKTGGLA